MPKPPDLTEMPEVTVTNLTTRLANLTQLEQVIRATLAYEQATVRAVYLSLVDESAIATLNERDRGKIGPTDVLSYPFDDSFPAGDGGELIISPAVAERHATAAGHQLADELNLLTVHSTLHLLGYKDETTLGATEMERRTALILHCQATGGQTVAGKASGG